ncbi:hypothetical protein MRS76_04490 [Rhizobiaceae bacterium n13]|uniref:Uncharacterized protein n=1 Tax=Ferirhizobium litorale TaxID=2927786 RepID=A0AAE3Q8S7_9HYPH|nr:hypothetical protein [Fererhizobium litorale]MDI7861205.1 hypothetical protein [Fererhizobium litorale]MDI7921352.1 hypothetical protein [Fererhizobium litorale]
MANQVNPNLSKPRDAHEVFTIDRPGKIILVGHHLSTRTHARCLVRTISLSTAELDINAEFEIPKNFFLEILGIPDEIGSTLIGREGSRAVIGFNMLLDAEFLRHLVGVVPETSHGGA